MQRPLGRSLPGVLEEHQGDQHGWDTERKRETNVSQIHDVTAVNRVRSHTVFVSPSWNRSQQRVSSRRLAWLIVFSHDHGDCYIKSSLLGVRVNTGRSGIRLFTNQHKRWDDGRSGQGAGSRGGDKWSHTKNTWKVEPTGIKRRKSKSRISERTVNINLFNLSKYGPLLKVTKLTSQCYALLHY